MKSLLKGNKEFVLIDSQKEIFEEAKHLAKKAQTGKKQVLIVEGGPGTGKSVVAINLLVALTNAGLVSQYPLRDAAGTMGNVGRRILTPSATAILWVYRSGRYRLFKSFRAGDGTRDGI